MNFPPFWARGRSGDFFSWRWSFQSMEEAQRLANEAAQKLADLIRGGGFPASHAGYYPGRPFREQVMREIKNATGETIAVITRNSYGCQVLNTSRVMFIDVDLPEPRTSGSFFKKLFGKPDVPPPNVPLNNALAKADVWARTNQDWGWRIYRTRAGLRLLATHALFDPTAAVVDTVFKEMDADPLYVHLCKGQKCYRARLTPKPWRCGLHEKPERWPWLSPKEEDRFQKWNARYQTDSQNWATCELVRSVGNSWMHSDVKTIVDIHDQATRAGSKLQLA